MQVPERMPCYRVKQKDETSKKKKPFTFHFYNKAIIEVDITLKSQIK